MKKIYNYFAFLIVLTSFSACTEDFKDWADPQTNPQEEAIEVTLQASNASTATFDLNDITSETVDIATATIDNPEGTVVTFDGQISKDESFENVVPADLSGNSDVLSIAIGQLQEAVATLYGKRPEARNLFVRFNGYVTTPAGQTTKVQSNTIQITVTPKASVIESSYYVTGDIIGGWGPDNVLKFNHSGKDVYEDPIFTLILENPAENANFKIIPQPAIEPEADFWGLAIGTAVDGDPALEGTIVTTNAGAIKIEEKGWVKITLNMMEYTYKIEPMTVSPYLWTPGNHQGWTPATSKKLYTANMDLIYNGHLYLDGGFKLTGQADWAPVEYGYSYFTSLSDNLTADGSNMVIDPGFYFVKVDLNTQTIEATLAEWSIIGDAAGGWNPENDVVMAYSKDTDTWSVTTDLVAGDFKFRANKDWPINMGGSADKLVFNTGNLNLPEAGNYTITLKLGNDEDSFCTITKN